MIIINNNNHASGMTPVSEPDLLSEKIREIGLRNFFGSSRRRLYVLLLLTASWSGTAHFYVGRIVLGVISIALTALAIPGIILLAVGILDSRPLWCWIVPLLSAALLPWIYGITAGVYWSLRTDEEFTNKYFR